MAGALTPVLLIVVTVLAAFASRRAGVTVYAVGWGLLALFAVFVLLLGDDVRRVAPLIAVLLGVTLFVPQRGVVMQGRQVAPSRKELKDRPGARLSRPATAARESSATVFGGEAIPGYEIVEKVGSGGMASVYKARRTLDGTLVALKIPMEQYLEDETFLRRFHREAEVAQRIDHPGVVRTFDHGSMGGRHYLAMEFVEGTSLDTFLEEGAADLEFFADVAVPVVDALAAIHAAGFVHRDVKPSNVMITNGGVREERPRVDPAAVKLMDFGIAGSTTLTRLTVTGARVGTPVYMSPEQARGEAMQPASDVYSLGLVFYEMLTGDTAFQGTYEAVVHQQVYRMPPPPRQRNVHVPKAIDALVMRMIAKDPGERPDLAEVRRVLSDASAWSLAESGPIPVRLVVALSERKGAIRALDPDGALHASYGDVGDGALTAVPTAVAVDEAGLLYAIVAARGVGGAGGTVVVMDEAGVEQRRFAPLGSDVGEVEDPVALAVAPGGGDVFVADAKAGVVKA